MGRTAFGRLLRDARQRALLTLESLAETSGVSVRAISDMERGHSLPRQATLTELMDALGLDEQERRKFVEASMRRTPRVPRQLPPDLDEFRGRKDVLASVHRLTSQAAGRDGHVVVSAIGGMAGVGKTTLAVHWAHQVAHRFPDGQLYVDLRGFGDSGKPLDPGEALGRFLGALGVARTAMPRGTEERSALFRERTASRRLIVVLDNAHTAEQVRPLLPASAGCLTIVTSRGQLSGLAVTEGAHLVTLDVWAREDALAALAARIGEDRCRAEPEAGAELVELCGFLPLAIAIIGRRLSASPQVPLHLAARELREAPLDALSAGGHGADVRTVFSWSYRTLTSDTARFFRRLALHPGPAASAQAAASLAGVGLAAARRQLRELTSAHLVSRDAGGLYALHDLVRAYGAELAGQEADDRSGARTRLLEYLRHNAQKANGFLTHTTSEPLDPPAAEVVSVAIGTREEASSWFRQEESTVLAALRSPDDLPLLRFRMNVTEYLGSYYAATGRRSEEIETRRTGLDAALRLDDPKAIAISSAGLARALAEAGQADEADRLVELLLGQLPGLDPAQRARAERSVGWVRGRQNRHAEALHHARNALELYRAAGDDEAAAREMNAVGRYLVLLGRYGEAITTCEEAIPLLQRSGDIRTEAAAWDTMGRARARLGDPAGAAADYRRSVHLYEQALDAGRQAEVLDRLASAELEAGDREGARASWVRAADLLSTVRSPRAARMRTKARALDPPSVPSESA